MIQSLIIFGQRTDIENLLDETTISNFIEEALENLSLTTSFDQFKDIFFRYLPNLILDVGLTLIKTTESERQDMYDKPQDFVNLALDTCDKQQSGIVKT
jgi:chaperonin cofactor prefoldin